MKSTLPERRGGLGTPFLRTLCASALLLAASSLQAAVTVIVPGEANPWLAGMPDGSEASFGDLAPAQSPVPPGGLVLTGGMTLTFHNVTGSVSYAGVCPGDPSNCFAPDGDAAMSQWNYNTRYDFGFAAGENGIAVLSAPLSSLLGVFLGDERPDLTPVPAALDFNPGAIGIDFVSLSPDLKQVFFIGDGRNASAQVQLFQVPAGATRLYLGTMDGFGWTGNNGGFTAEVSVVPEPESYLLMLGGMVLIGLTLRRRRGG